MIPHTIEEAAKKDSGCFEQKKDYVELKERQQAAEEIQIGSWIGILEREIMLLLALMGQYGAIGFVLTAKSLARFKQLENKAFAEKYLGEHQVLENKEQVRVYDTKHQFVGIYRYLSEEKRFSIEKMFL